MKKEIQTLTKEWYEVLKEEFTREYFINLSRYIEEQRKNQEVFPKEEEVFSALNTTPLSKVKVVLLGQDPYHGENQANGLAFSVKKGNKIPPSLRNIFKELNSDVGCDIPKEGDLTQWAKEGVLLLNTVLTVRSGEANSHKAKGWEEFTDRIIELVNQKCEHVVFLLLGANAQSKEKILDSKKHLILKAPHPSPLSAYRGFFGSCVFSQTNDYLEGNGILGIRWCLEH